MPRKTVPTSYWTFFCNPRIWEVDRHLATNPQEGTYRITPYQTSWFGIGQLGVIRVGVDHRNKKELDGRQKLQPGIYAIISVASAPLETLPDEPGFYLHPQKQSRNRSWRVRYHMVKNLLHRPIIFSDHLEDEWLYEDRYLVKGFQAASMPLHPLTFRRILELSEEGDIYFS